MISARLTIKGEWTNGRKRLINTRMNWLISKARYVVYNDSEVYEKHVRKANTDRIMASD